MSCARDENADLNTILDAYISIMHCYRLIIIFMDSPKTNPKLTRGAWRLGCVHAYMCIHLDVMGFLGFINHECMSQKWPLTSCKLHLNILRWEQMAHDLQMTFPDTIPCINIVVFWITQKKLVSKRPKPIIRAKDIHALLMYIWYIYIL